MKTASLLFAVLLTSSTLIGCGEGQRLYECNQICQNYADCVDSDIDKSDCVDHCEAMGDVDPDFEQKATDCENCLDDKACAEAATACVSTCDDVTAESTGS